MLLEEPQKFGLTNAVLARAEGVRILELGAGTGLVSLAATNFCLEGVWAAVVASDYHPTVLNNLDKTLRRIFLLLLLWLVTALLSRSAPRVAPVPHFHLIMPLRPSHAWSKRFYRPQTQLVRVYRRK